jgi:tyrosyl-tRNA synthetase
MKLFTEVSLEEIAELSRLEGSALNDVKGRLADEATAMLHGGDCLASIHQTSTALFSSGGGGGAEDLSSLPTLAVSGGSIDILDALILSSLASSKSDGKRQVAAGAIRLNGVQVTDCFLTLTKADSSEKGAIKLSSGKKKHMVIQFES